MSSVLSLLGSLPPPPPAWMNPTLYYLLVNVAGSLVTGAVADALCQVVSQWACGQRTSGFHRGRTACFAVGIAAVCGPLAMLWYRRVLFRIPVPAGWNRNWLRIGLDTFAFGAVYVAAGFAAVTAVEKWALNAPLASLALKPWLKAYGVYCLVWFILDLLLFNRWVPPQLNVLVVSAVRTGL
eukprot:EG_transcript_34688